MGRDITVSLYDVTGSGISEAASLLGKWYTCNYGPPAGISLSIDPYFPELSFHPLKPEGQTSKSAIFAV